MFWLLLVLVLVLLLLLVPFSLELFIETEGKLRVEARTRWGVLPLGTGRSGVPSVRPVTKKVPRPREGRARGTTVSWHKLRALLTSEDFVASLGRWLGRLLRLLAPTDVRVSLRFGTGDPYETGRLWAAVSPLLVLLGQAGSAELELAPDFVEPAFALEAHARVRVVPLVLLAALLGYFFTPASWRALGNYARG